VNQITIAYLGQNYVVPLTTDPSAFYIKSTVGTPITVDAGTAANLFGAEKAVLLLENLHNNAGIDSLYADWNNVITSTGTTLALEGAANALAGVTGSLIVSAITGGTAVATIAVGAAKAIGPALIGLTPSVADLALVSTLFSEAKNLLSGADSAYQGFLSGESPIQFETIRSTINDTLLALGIGNAATEASQEIPGVNDSVLDDVINFASNFIGPLVDLANETGSILNTVASSLETNILGTADIGGHIDAVNALQDQVDFGDFLTSQIAQIIKNSTYGPLTDTGLQTAANSLAGSPYVQPSTPAELYAISPPSTIDEDSGAVSFTVTRHTHPLISCET